MKYIYHFEMRKPSLKEVKKLNRSHSWTIISNLTILLCDLYVTERN